MSSSSGRRHGEARRNWSVRLFEDEINALYQECDNADPPLMPSEVARDLIIRWTERRRNRRLSRGRDNRH